MSQYRFVKFATVLALCGGLAVSTAVSAVEVSNLKDQGVDALFGRYAPRGDCKREPLILVDQKGMSFKVAGKTTRTTTFEYAVSYGAHDYQGMSKWFFPFITKVGYPILMSFNADEKTGALTIGPHDEGWKGGPPLGATNRALVAGSPYAKCK